MMYAFCASLRLGHFRPYPVKLVLDLRVHSKLARRRTPVTPAGGTVEIKPSPWFTHHWTSWVSLARIDTTSIPSSTDHGVVDFARVGPVTSCPAATGTEACIRVCAKAPPDDSVPQPVIQHLWLSEDSLTESGRQAVLIKAYSLWGCV